MSNLRTTEKVPSLIVQRLSEEDKQRRASILSELRNEPASSSLQAYFKRLAEGSPNWDETTFIEGARCFANLIGPERVNYYSSPLKGIHYPHSFTMMWNQIYPQQAITVWDYDIRRQFPATWSTNPVMSSYALTCEEEPAYGLNRLAEGPTTLDCGMVAQVLILFAMRYVFGDELFNKAFKLKRGKFTITQTYERPLGHDVTNGSLLYYFYDQPVLDIIRNSLSRIRTRTFFNHATYLAKHPGGAGQLHNVTQIDNDYIVFDPFATQNILSKAQLERRCIEAYNAPRDYMDLEKLFIYRHFPDFKHPDFAPKTFGALAEEAESYTDHTLDEKEWEDGQVKREQEANGLHLIFNFERLVRSFEKIKDGIDEDVLLVAKDLWLDEMVANLSETRKRIVGASIP